jgi:hypothetical protein
MDNLLDIMAVCQLFGGVSPNPGQGLSLYCTWHIAQTLAKLEALLQASL